MKEVVWSFWKWSYALAERCCESGVRACVCVCTRLALSPCCGFPSASGAAGDAAASGPRRGLWDFKCRTPEIPTAANVDELLGKTELSGLLSS